MIDVRTATIEHVRDYIAERHGWRRSPDRIGWYTPGGGFTLTHEFKGTLDAAARAMPERWMWTRHSFMEGWPKPESVLQWRASGWVHWDMEDATIKVVTVPDTGDECADRYRLAALAWQAMEAATLKEPR